MIHQLRQRKEEAQAMVLMAAAMLGMLAFLGLAIDGGNVYYQRRNAQNAADAASQMGTIKLAEYFAKSDAQRTADPLTEAELCTYMKDYGTIRNPSDPTQFVPMYAYQSRVINCASTAEVKDWESSLGTRALTGIASPSYISQILGRTNFKVQGTATVQYGPPASILGGNGAFPVVLKDEWLEGRVDYLGKALNPPQPRYDINNPNDPNDPSKVPANMKFAIWDDKKGATGMYDIAGGNRSWANLRCVANRVIADPDCSGSAAILKDMVRDGYKGELQIGDQIEGKQGVAASIVQEAAALVGKTITVPIYHDTHPVGGQTYYHIVGFASFRLTKVVASGPSKGVEGYFVNFVAASGGMAPSGTTNYGTVVIQPTG